MCKLPDIKLPPSVSKVALFYELTHMASAFLVHSVFAVIVLTKTTRAKTYGQPWFFVNCGDLKMRM
jgi:hypothetical protein